MKGRILLASASPRRRELLKMVVEDFHVLSGVDLSEEYPNDLPKERVPEYLAMMKANAYANALEQDDVLITADTVVIVDDIILGKPNDFDQAKKMLSMLSGRRHKVVTGVTLLTLDDCRTFSQTTYVDFDYISPQDIEHYVTKYEPYDKAGAYGIQEWIGAAAIKGIEGSFYNVMGLPVHALFVELRKMGVV